MPKTKYEQNKKYAAKWDKENRVTISCKVSYGDRDKFKSWAEAHGMTVSGAIAAFVRQCIEEADAMESDSENQ